MLGRFARADHDAGCQAGRGAGGPIDGYSGRDAKPGTNHHPDRGGVGRTDAKLDGSVSNGDPHDRRVGDRGSNGGKPRSVRDAHAGATADVRDLAGL